jgi:diguanylate cyclase (GGDEF)-like protein
MRATTVFTATLASGAPHGGFVIALIAVGCVAGTGVAAGLAVIARRRLRTRKALRDDVTGLGNRRRLDRDLATGTDDADTPVAVVIIDVDHFKRINDGHGQAAADRALQRIAEVIAKSVRGADVVYRSGEEEFCALLSNTTISDAGQVAERIRAAIARASLSFDRPLTVSIGVALGKGNHVAHTMQRAGDAKFKSTIDGRDRVTIAPQPLLVPKIISPTT